MSVTRSVINFGKSVTASVINYGKSVTRSVMRCFIRLQIQTLSVWELITVTDADTDTDFNFLELVCNHLQPTVVGSFVHSLCVPF